MKFKVLLLDIEGTTTSINFVKDELFGYVRRNLHKYVVDNWDKTEVQDCIQELEKLTCSTDALPASLALQSMKNPPQGQSCQEAFIANVLKLMDHDVKTTALKTFQGMMWREAYAKEEVKGHLYEDVAPNLINLTHDGIRIYIYSSGSVEAQKLLFNHSVSGDITKFLSGYFDTTTGPKTDATSYVKIAESVGLRPADILFLTDVVREAKPAKEAGLQVALVKRPGNAPLESALPEVPVIEDFGALESW